MSEQHDRGRASSSSSSNACAYETLLDISAWAALSEHERDNVLRARRATLTTMEHHAIEQLPRDFTVFGPSHSNTSPQSCVTVRTPRKRGRSVVSFSHSSRFFFCFFLLFFALFFYLLILYRAAERTRRSALSFTPL